MVVVDTGSDDNTAAIAAAGCGGIPPCLAGPFLDSAEHFAGIRDRRLDSHFGWGRGARPGSLARLSPSHLNDTEHPAVEFEIVNYLSDEASIGNAHLQQQLRLFKRTEFHRYQGLIHNQLVDVRNGSALSASRVPVQVLHYGYTPTVWNAQGCPTGDAREGARGRTRVAICRTILRTISRFWAIRTCSDPLSSMFWRTTR